jgi:DNA-binding transcriptional ArsR family regulator
MLHAKPLQCRRQARVFKALGHPTRLFMVLELGKGERCVCELQELVGADMSTVSKHLSVLREANLVRDERRGAQVFYSLTAPCVLSFMGCIEGLSDPQTAGTTGVLQTLPGDRT